MKISTRIRTGPSSAKAGLQKLEFFQLVSQPYELGPPDHQTKQIIDSILGAFEHIPVLSRWAPISRQVDSLALCIQVTDSSLAQSWLWLDFGCRNIHPRSLKLPSHVQLRPLVPFEKSSVSRICSRCAATLQQPLELGTPKNGRNTASCNMLQSFWSWCFHHVLSNLKKNSNAYRLQHLLAGSWWHLLHLSSAAASGSRQGRETTLNQQSKTLAEQFQLHIWHHAAYCCLTNVTSQYIAMHLDGTPYSQSCQASSYNMLQWWLTNSCVTRLTYDAASWSV